MKRSPTYATAVNSGPSPWDSRPASHCSPLVDTIVCMEVVAATNRPPPNAIEETWPSTGVSSAVQAIPSRDIRTKGCPATRWSKPPPAGTSAGGSPPAATKVPLAHTIVRRGCVPIARNVHCIPSVEVRIDVFSPTATNSPPPQVIPIKSKKKPAERGVHVTPSDEVRILPKSPTATHSPLPQATARNVFCVSESTASQLLPSSETRIVPSSPTAT